MPRKKDEDGKSFQGPYRISEWINTKWINTKQTKHMSCSMIPNIFTAREHTANSGLKYAWNDKKRIRIKNAGNPHPSLCAKSVSKEPWISRYMPRGELCRIKIQQTRKASEILTARFIKTAYPMWGGRIGKHFRAKAAIISTPAKKKHLKQQSRGKQ